MKKGWLSAFCLVLLMSMFLAACGTSGQTKETGAPGGGKQEEVATAKKAS
ncbi:hypothetical protein LJK87_44625 [Paenibacillus sp. P25]|nr:hypothetical protein LJK87_44625 [Paenibacillus sp. P25]